MLSFHLHLGLPNQNPVNTSPLPMRGTCPAHLIAFHNMPVLYGEESPPKHLSCPLLLIQYIRSCPRYLVAVSSTCKLCTCSASGGGST
jgi:hypothetical protein